MRPIRYFSLEEANRALVRVTPLLTRLKGLHTAAVPLKTRVDALWRRLEGGERVLEDIATLQRQLDAQAKEIAQILHNLERIGCLLRDAQIGLVDFPARASDTEFYLCWHLGEDAVGAWHGMHEGFSSRKPLSTMPGRVIH